MPRRLLFVCAGNTCRSPMAEAVARVRYADRFEVSSAGYMAPPGGRANPGAVEVVREHLGYDLSSHATTDLENMDLSSFDLFVALDERSACALRRDRDVQGKEVVIWDVRDPFGQPREEYEARLLQIARLVDDLAKRYPAS